MSTEYNLELILTCLTFIISKHKCFRLNEDVQFPALNKALQKRIPPKWIFANNVLQTSNSLQTSGFENHVSSATTWGVLGLSLYTTAAVEEVKTTRFTDGDFAHDLRTLRVPLTAGSINSAWNKEN